MCPCYEYVYVRVCIRSYVCMYVCQLILYLYKSLSYREVREVGREVDIDEYVVFLNIYVFCF